MNDMRSTLVEIDNPGLALRHRPLSLLATSWPWRCLAHLLTTPVVAVVWLLTCWILFPLAVRPLGRVERWRLRLVDRHAAPDPHTEPATGGIHEWVRHRLHEQITWTELLYGLLLILMSVLEWAVLVLALLLPTILATAAGLNIALLALGVEPSVVDQTSGPLQYDMIAQICLLALGLVLLTAGMYIVTLTVEAHRQLARFLICVPESGLVEQVDGLARSRERVTTAFDAERRRIERDLHDGVQQRLTSLVMTLGVLKYQHEHGEDIVPIIDQARNDAQDAVDELREIVHGIYPSALREHDLPDALDDLVCRARATGLTVTSDIDVAQDLPADTEVGLYFAVSELFTNIIKHAGAASASLTVRHDPDMTIVVTVSDNGRGGAQPRGSGLIGVVDRIETLGGRVRISSPAGGPTRIILEVPCASS